MLGRPAPATAADELLISSLPDEIREALRRLLYDDLLPSVLDVDMASEFPSAARDLYTKEDMIDAYRAGWSDACDAFEPPDDHVTEGEVVANLKSAGVL